MRYLCFINGVETPIQDGAVPNVPGAPVALFFLNQENEYQLIVDTVAGPDDRFLSRKLEPFGLRAVAGLA